MSPTEFALDYTRLLTGGTRVSPLLTDAYKLRMGEVGEPLREEIFTLHFRRGPALRVPFDLQAVVHALRPALPSEAERAFLLEQGYTMTPAMEHALEGRLRVDAAPAGAWVGAMEPVVTVVGPSFLVSWLEPLLVALHFPLQVATALAEGRRAFDATCDEEAGIIQLVARASGLAAGRVRVRVRAAAYRAGVARELAAISDALGGSLDRAFEVGARAMSCLAAHRMVLEACRDAGLTRTSNVGLARILRLTPVGTTGHEHQMRFGDDATAFRAVRDRSPAVPSYLFDTYDPIRLGLPAAFAVAREDPERPFTLRFDSGDQRAQLAISASARDYGREGQGVRGGYVFMDGYDAARTAEMERYADSLDLASCARFYGYGGALVSKPSPSPFHRDTVAMVYKLARTAGRDVMKHAGDPGKSSLPGHTVSFVAPDGGRVIAHAGEGVSCHRPLDADAPRPTAPARLSRRVQAAIAVCRDRDLRRSV
jgi:nicotinic acid phosphoribosyltransferase